jgi:hypothetical protein
MGVPSSPNLSHPSLTRCGPDRQERQHSLRTRDHHVQVALTMTSCPLGVPELGVAVADSVVERKLVEQPPPGPVQLQLAVPEPQCAQHDAEQDVVCGCLRGGLPLGGGGASARQSVHEGQLDTPNQLGPVLGPIELDPAHAVDLHKRRRQTNESGR